MACVVGVVLGVAAPLDEVVHIGLGDLPWVSVDQPVVGLLDLPAVVDLLIEDAELVADAVADGRALEGGQRVEIACRQPSQAAVAQAGLLLATQHLVDVLPKRRQRLTGRVLDAEVDQVAAKLRPHQKFGREVAGNLPAQVERSLCGRDPVVLHAVAHGQRKCPVVMLWFQRGRRPADRVAQVVDDSASQRVGGGAGAAVLVCGGGCLDDVGHQRSLAVVDVGKMNGGPRNGNGRA